MIAYLDLSAHINSLRRCRISTLYLFKYHNEQLITIIITKMDTKFSLVILLSLFLIHTNLRSTNAQNERAVLYGEQSPCLRECKSNSPPMECHYKFILEWYQTLSRACYDCPYNVTDCFRQDCVPADGTNRAILVVNRKMPGPSIQVCEGDEVVVDVENRMVSEEVTIHWHGQHQKLNPYMDGVPYVTQCPIASGSSFRYRFKAENSGTHFWHSHIGNQRGEGVYGPMIVRTPKNQDPHKHLYDFDMPSHTITITDWLHETALSTYTKHHHSDGGNNPNSLLVNGLGFFRESTTNGGVPPARFVVKKNKRYRFRVINAEFLACPIEISIDNHTFTVISTDGFDVKPITVDSFVTYSGERFDVIVNANQDIDNYWIRFRGMISCARNKAHQVAVLHYEGANMDEYPAGVPSYETSKREGVQLNSVNQDMENEDAVIITELDSIASNDISLKEIPDYKFIIHYDFYNITNLNYYVPGLYEFSRAHPKFNLVTPQLNHISLGLPPFPLLSERDLITPDMFCNSTTVQNCRDEFCQCTHVLQVPLNSVVELILIDVGLMFDGNHPFHLHGNAFRVVAMDRLGSNVTVEEIRELDRLGLIKRKLDHAPVKDTVTVPDGGYTILRFQATNPGYWLFHCHIDFHAEVGMALVFKVGEHSDMLPVPENFPKCGNWMSNEK